MHVVVTPLLASTHHFKVRDTYFLKIFKAGCKDAEKTIAEVSRNMYAHFENFEFFASKRKNAAK